MRYLSDLCYRFATGENPFFRLVLGGQILFSSNVVLEELVRKSLRASPFTNPFLTPNGWLEEK